MLSADLLQFSDGWRDNRASPFHPKTRSCSRGTEDQVARFLAPPDVGALERRLRKDEADRLRASAAKATVPESSGAVILGRYFMK